MPSILSERLAELLAPRCATCRSVLDPGEPVTNHGDMQFHLECSPACAMCGTRLRRGEGGWRGEATVVSEPWGYGMRPLRFWCAACLGSSLRDPPRSVE